MPRTQLVAAPFSPAALLPEKKKGKGKRRIWKGKKHNFRKGKNRRNKERYLMRDWMLRGRSSVEGKNGLAVGVLFGDGFRRQRRDEGLTDGSK